MGLSTYLILCCAGSSVVVSTTPTASIASIARACIIVTIATTAASIASIARASVVAAVPTASTGSVIICTLLSSLLGTFLLKILILQHATSLLHQLAHCRVLLAARAAIVVAIVIRSSASCADTSKILLLATAGADAVFALVHSARGTAGGTFAAVL